MAGLQDCRIAGWQARTADRADEPPNQDPERERRLRVGGGAQREIKKRRDRRLIVCRNIKTLFNFDPPATDEEIRAASVQFVRKLSGFTKPSQANQVSFDLDVDD